MTKPNKPFTLRTKFDYVLYFLVFTTPLFEVPQAIEIYSNKSAANVSLLTWSYFQLYNLVWLIYGIKNQIKPLVIAYTLYMLVEGSIVIGIIIYR